MLWYKAWLETRWPFLIGLIILMLTAGVVVLAWPTLLKIAAEVPQGSFGPFSEGLRQTTSTYQSYVWSQWYAKNLLEIWICLAIILGAGGLVSEGARSHALYTLSLPVTRRHLCAVRAALGGIELTLLALLPSIIISCLSPAIGQSFPLPEALMRSLVLALSGMFLYGLSILLSSFVAGRIRVIALGLGVAVMVAILPSLIPALAGYGLVEVMSGPPPSVTFAHPWRTLSTSLALVVALIYSSFRIVENRDF